MLEISSIEMIQGSPFFGGIGSMWEVDILTVLVLKVKSRKEFLHKMKEFAVNASDELPEMFSSPIHCHCL